MPINVNIPAFQQHFLPCRYPELEALLLGLRPFQVSSFYYSFSEHIENRRARRVP